MQAKWWQAAWRAGLLVVFMAGAGLAQPGSYPQEYALTLAEPGRLGLGAVHCCLLREDGLWLGAARGVLHLGSGQPTRYGPGQGLPAGPVVALCAARGALYAATTSSLARWERSWRPVAGRWHGISALAGDGQRLALADAAGLHLLAAGRWTQAPYPQALSVRSLALAPGGPVWVATDRGLWRWAAGKWAGFGPGTGHAGMATAAARALLADRFGHLWVGTAAGLEVSDGRGWWERITGKEGLPYQDVTCLAQAGPATWIGTSEGLVRMEGREWHYYWGERWLPDNRVLALAARPGAVYAVTPGGVAKIYTRTIALAEKAAHYQRRLERRHLRLGYAAECRLQNAQDFTTFRQGVSENDGLWTSLHVVAQSYRYAVTRDPAARRLAAKSLQALLDLERKCSIRGYFARTLVKKDPAAPRQGREWHDTPDGKYQWLGDTSSDEIDGHFYAYSVFYDLVANAQEKRQIAEVTGRVMDYILDHGLLLLDVDGKPTRWGVWAPSHLNRGLGWIEERGLNSLEILSHLRAAYHFTGKPRFLAAYHSLVREHHYALNTMYAKTQPPLEINHSDDELAFCAYYPLLRYEDDPELRRLYLFSFERTWQIERPEHCPWFNFMYGALTGKAYDQEESIRVLRDSPMDLRGWQVHNSQRADLEVSPPDRAGDAQATRALPADERPIMKWNGNPYQLDGGGDGAHEDDGTFWLLPYWMGRHYRFLTD